MDARRHKLIDDVRKGIADQTTRKGVLDAAIRLIDDFSPNFDWSGFYMMEGNQLVVASYIGPETPHTVISLDSGICGAAASTKRSVIVDDVLSDPRFLACSITTRSEIVVPLMDGDTVIGEIDIDSNTPAFFTDDDRVMLEAVAAAVVERLKVVSRLQ
jgi:L-methionine (R)-S-oxide reductase